MPKASIVITTNNRPHLLPRAVASAQSAGEDVEVIVVDDASNDETAEVCRTLEGIRYIRLERNQGVAGARNVGILASSAPYIAFLDDDDLRLPGSLDTQLEALASNPNAGFVYGQALIADQNGGADGSFYPNTCPGGDIFWELLSHNFIPCGSVVFRKSCLYCIGLLDESNPGIDDWDLWIRLAEIYAVVSLEHPVVMWRRPTPTSGQGSSKPVHLISLSVHLLRRRWLKLPRSRQASPRVLKEVRRKFSMNVMEHLVWESVSAFMKGNIEHAWENTLAALQLYPTGAVSVARKWTQASTLRILLAGGFTRNGLMKAKAHFKQVRAKKSI
jgi:glycosyltransferase involved in cell wall biosynthesis